VSDGDAALAPIEQLAPGDFEKLRADVRRGGRVGSRAAQILHRARLQGRLAVHMGGQPALTPGGKPLDGGR
jgi:hypothetical protein